MDTNVCLHYLGSLWDLDAFWYSDRPRLRPCFEKTVLVWIPCLIYFLLLPIDLWQSSCRKSKASNLCRLCLFRKVCITLVLLVSNIRLIITSIQDYKLYGIIDMLVIFSMALMSECFFIAMLLSICKRTFSTWQWISILCFAIFGLPELCRKMDNLITANLWPERNEPMISRLFFVYMWKLSMVGCKKILQLSDLWTLDELDQSENLCQQLVIQYERVKVGSKKKPEQYLIMALLRIYWKSLIVIVILIFIRDVTVLIVLFDVKALIRIAMNDDEPKWHGIVYITILFSATAIRRLVFNHQEFIMIKMGIRIKCAVSSFVMKKSLRLSPKSRREFSPGDITNLVSVDVEQVLEQAKYLYPIITAPFLVGINIVYMLYNAVGHACWPGVFVIGIRLILCWIDAKYYRRYFGQQMTEKDKRMSILVEMLKIMKTVKLYAWELAFQKFIGQIRERELDALKKSHIFTAIGDMLWSTTNAIALIVIFWTYVYGFEHTLRADVAFQVIIIIWFSAPSVDPLPQGICGATIIIGSLKRLSRFMAAEELEPYVTNICANDDIVISVNQGEFSWDTNGSSILKNVTLNIKKGQLVAIIGQVGSGKSSLLSAIAGEMYKCGGCVSLSGTLVYVPQQSWILNDTLRGNILFNKSYDDQYDTVIGACALKPDLDCLPAGDMTEIGERGVNLSGGQKQRISLARSIYQDKDIYLLDDPLSAVDINVQKHLFHQAIGPKGLLQHKTRLLVTHAVSYLSYCDLIVVMQNGNIIDSGTYDEISIKYSNLLSMVKPSEDKTITEDNFRAPNKSDQIKLSGKLSQEEAVAWSAYWLYFKSGMAYFAPYCLLALFATSCNVALLIWVQIWTQNNHKTNTTMVIISDTKGLITLTGIGAVQFMFSLAFISLYHHFTINASKSMHKQLLSSVLRASITFFDTTPIGRILNRFSQDIFVIDVKFPLCMNFVVIYTLSCISAIIPSLYAMPILIVFILPFAVAFVLLQVQKFYIKTATQLKRLEALSRSPIYSRVQDLLQGPENIRIYGQQQVFTNSLNSLMDTNASAQLCLFTASKWLSTNMDWLGTFIITLVISFAVFSSNISASMLGLSISSILAISEFMKLLILNLCETEASSVSLERISEYLQLEQEADWIKSHTPDMHDESGRTKRRYWTNLQSSAPMLKQWPQNGEIEFIDYCLRYRPDLPFALDHLNFKILPGQKVGIVGRTGAGKTSLTVALFRLIEPAQGKILIDSIDISTLGLHELRKQITIIPQDPSVFSGTIRKNLDPFDEHTDCEIWSALESSHLKPYVVSLKNGLDHKLDDAGSNLSVGQRQLLCLARALLKRSKILVLDEATASVDLETDQLIQESIRSQFAECTVITIAHRLETIMDYDRVIVLSNGQILEDGKVNDLLSQKSIQFRQLSMTAGTFENERLDA